MKRFILLFLIIISPSSYSCDNNDDSIDDALQSDTHINYSVAGTQINDTYYI
ncbi:hypothetical protein DFQ11_105162 [Winogradskyella epiphytica]|uniref:Uncharacterized protein n=1 Tax=Winogradskyella epiphytica TaxID=262005 RepID=A0A2V4XHD7_9FLAO|nr:hypothetical protein [Winogradskyella epiphytica]PYE80563.1 hypothetical protein DFQ11_105162 [Winogradskyella epiphytica]